MDNLLRKLNYFSAWLVSIERKGSEAQPRVGAENELLLAPGLTIDSTPITCLSLFHLLGKKPAFPARRSPDIKATQGAYIRLDLSNIG